MFPGKIALVIEPAIAIITNQVDSLQKKGIDAIALGSPASSTRKPANFRRVFKSTDLPAIAFCTPEYLLGADSCRVILQLWWNCRPIRHFIGKERYIKYGCY